VLTAALVGCTGDAGTTGDRGGSSGSDAGSTGSRAAGGLTDSRQPVLDVAALRRDAAAIVQRTPKELATDRLAEGLVPPTNRWFSALALGPEPQPVFPTPLSFTPSDRGFAFGVPRVTTSEAVIAGPASSDVAVTLPGLATTVVVAHDELTVTLEHRGDEGRAIGRTVLGRGSPFVTFTAARPVRIRQSLPTSGSPAVATVQGRVYGVVHRDADGAARSSTGPALSLAQGATATWFAVPDGGSAAEMAELAAPLTGGRTAYRVTDDTATTHLELERPDGAPEGAVAVLPHQRGGLARGSRCDLGTFPTVFGAAAVCRGTTVTWDAPVRPVVTDLDLSGLTDGERDELARQVRADIADTPAFPADTYFGGKALQRLTQLWRLAVTLGLDDAAERARGTLVAEMDRWTEPTGCDERPASCFVHDPAGRGIVGLTPSFGSDEFNDHHFHYGYFLYAAGALAADDPALAARWAPVMDLLAADVAASGTDGLFPDRRAFDPYAAQSWASGTAPFADGNNQESTSEAVNAWVGLTLWARARQNRALEDSAAWMLAGEQSTALRYGLRLDRSEPAYRGFGHEVVSLTWGGKRDWATWFSPEPAAKLAILLLPASPSAAAYLGGEPERIRAAVAEATAGKGYQQQFGDYLLMYAALPGGPDRQAALDSARALDARWVDDGNSRAYLLAWVMAAG
jgi:hypothetical protein